MYLVLSIWDIISDTSLGYYIIFGLLEFSAIYLLIALSNFNII